MSRHSKEALVRLGLGEQSVHVVPYGVDVPDRAPEHRTGGPVHCLSVGRMVAKKAPLLVLESFRRALGKTPDMRLTMVGDGPLRDAAVDYVRCHDLQKHAELTGSRTPTEVRALLGSADIFVQHSVVDPETGDSEGLPVAILEAMANGLPVVSTRHAGIPEAVVEHETGFLVEEQDVDAMADAIAQLAASASLRERMGGAGHSRAKEHFTWDLERERLRQILGLG
jgi:glycosyltransferase involved in cell wall biosynthesis